MGIIYPSIILLGLLSAIGTFVLAIRSLRDRSNRTAIYLSGLLYAISWWALFNFLENVWVDLPGKVFWSKIEYFGIIPIPLLMLAFALQYTHREHWIRKKHVLVLLVIPVTSLVAVWTNPWHHLFDSTATVVHASAFHLLLVSHGPIFWLHAAYAYFLVSLAILLLVDAVYRSAPSYRGRQWLVMAGVVFPLVLNILSLGGVFPQLQIDLTPEAFSITGILIYIAVFRQNLLSVTPIARNAVIENMLDGMLLVNQEKYVIDLNPVMENWLGMTSLQVIGRRINEIIPEIGQVCHEIKCDSPATFEVETNFQNHHQTMEVHTSQIKGEHKQIIGHVLVLRDVTERRCFQQSLWQTKELLEKIFNNTDLSVAYLDRDLRVVKANRAFSEIAGKQVEDLVGIKLFECFPDAEREMRFQQVLVTGEAYSACSEPLNKRSGRTSYWDWSLQPIWSASGEAEGLVLMMVDVTERECASRALADALELNQHIISASSIGILAFDASGRCVLANQAAMAIMDGTAGQALQVNFRDLANWKASGLIDISEAILATGESQRCIIRLSAQPEQEAFFECFFTTFTSSNQKHLLILSHDITERRLAEEELRRSERRFHTLVESMNDLVFTLDRAGKYQEIFGQSFEKLGIKRECILGLTPEELFPRDEVAVHVAASRRALQGEPVVYEWESKGRHFQTSLSPIPANGKVEGIVGVGRDITTLKELEMDLEEAKSLLEQAFAQSPVPMVLLRSPDGVVEMMNSACEASLKIPASKGLMGISITQARIFWEIRASDDTPLPQERWPVSIVIGGEVLQNSEYKIVFADGSTGWLIVNGTPIYNRMGSQVAALLVFIDITERKQIEQAEREQRLLAEAYRDMAAILNSTVQLDTVLTLVLANIERLVPHDAASVVLFDAEGEVARSQFRGYSADEQKNALSLCIRAAETEGWRNLNEDRQAIFIADIMKEPVWVGNTGFKRMRAFINVPIRSQAHPIGMLTLASTTPGFFTKSHADRLKVFTDQAAVAITNARLYTEVQHLTLMDELTRIYNYRGLLGIGQREFDRAVRFNRPLSLIFFDIDNFRDFNNRYSHAVGNQVLQVIAKTARESLRLVDLIARFGGEEFVVILPETNLESAYQIAERLRIDIESAFVTTSFGRLSITISAGVAELSQGISSLSMLIEKANQCEHRAKQAGRNQVAVEPLPFINSDSLKLPVDVDIN